MILYLLLLITVGTNTEQMSTQSISTCASPLSRASLRFDYCSISPLLQAYGKLGFSLTYRCTTSSPYYHHLSPRCQSDPSLWSSSRLLSTLFESGRWLRKGSCLPSALCDYSKCVHSPSHHPPGWRGTKVSRELEEAASSASLYTTDVNPTLTTVLDARRL